jgi:hypothetical protein
MNEATKNGQAQDTGKIGLHFVNNLFTIFGDSGLADSVGYGRATMQKVYPRTNPAPFEASDNSTAKPVTRVEDALREFSRQDASQGLEPENTSQVVPDVNSLIQRVAGVSLSPLENVISDLQQLHDFLHNEGERIQREISDYLQLSQTAMGSTKMIADNIVLWKETAHSTAHTREKRSAATERADFVAPAPLPSPSPTATKDLFIPPK